MKKQVFITVMTALLLGCSGTTKNIDSNDIKYSEAKNYYFRNDAVAPSSPKITSQEQFDELFGAAPVMGTDGEPTQIDFTKQFVIATILPETDCPTEIIPRTLKTSGDSLIFTYKANRREKSTFTMRPIYLLIVDKNNDRHTTIVKEE